MTKEQLERRIYLLRLLFIGTRAFVGRKKHHPKNTKGICEVITYYKSIKIISDKDENDIVRYIEDKSGHYHGRYWWKEGKRKPRIKFLQKLIKKNIKKLANDKGL